ncbi:MAG: hypothetical protein CVU69_02665 [Deltaproteobacteria bacterium HGW-Deltaproteobacteria-4]|nr:MAG: hypothetical protein CVU69_02665 [Deltaproteobacteria bacterium HGW-Deltaproteobacteria-4]
MASDMKFVIIANPRTGTNHFIDLLNSHPNISCHREVFHRHSVYLLEGTRDDLFEKRNHDPVAFLHELYNSSPTQACGFKIFMGHDDVVLNTVLQDPEIKKIILYRPNFLAVYSSDMIAEAEQRYLIFDQTQDRIDSGIRDKARTSAKAVFDRTQFEMRWRDYHSHYQKVVKVLNETNQVYLFMTYDDYINEGLFRRVFPFLGLAQPEQVQTRMKKMNSSDILSRFANPDEVRDYLTETGILHWAHEGFMIWPQV